MEILKQIHNEQLHQTHCGFQRELDDQKVAYERRIKEMREGYERKVEEMRLSYEKLADEKDEKIKELEGIIGERFARIERQIASIKEHFDGEQLESEKKENTERKVTRFLLKQYARENRQLTAKLKRDLDIQKKTTEVSLFTLRYFTLH